MVWRVIEDGELDIYRNLSIEESLAKVNADLVEKTNTLRLWQSDKSVVIGRFQCVHKEVDLNYCQKEGIQIARRFTGGGAVYHGIGNLNFTICADQRRPYVSRSLKKLYQGFVGSIADGLREIGIPVAYDEKKSCLRIGKKKVTGTAGWIKQGVSFLHGTLLIDADIDTLKRSLDAPSGQTKYLRDRTRIRCKLSKRDVVTTISAEVSSRPSDAKIRAAIVRSVATFTGENVESGNLTQTEINTAQVLYQSRYSLDEWNLGIPAPRQTIDR
jgi:lipoate-protein ligase A